MYPSTSYKKAQRLFLQQKFTKVWSTLMLGFNTYMGIIIQTADCNNALPPIYCPLQNRTWQRIEHTKDSQCMEHAEDSPLTFKCPTRKWLVMERKVASRLVLQGKLNSSEAQAVLTWSTDQIVFGNILYSYDSILANLERLKPQSIMNLY